MKALLFAICVVLVHSSALACSCAGSPDPVGSVESHDEVFLGRVLFVEDVHLDQSGMPPTQDEHGLYQGRTYRVTVFRVNEKWKGSAGRLVLVATDSGAGDCGYVFESGKSYVVYANLSSRAPFPALVGADRALTTHICSPTALLEDSPDLPARIRVIHPPLPGPFPAR